jgi:chromosome segregation ATPase
VTITQDLRTRRKHRGKTPWQLVQTIGRLEREADVRECELVALATRVSELYGERTQLEGQLDQAAIDLSTALDDLRQAREQLAAYKAAEANTNRVDVPSMVRDTSAIEDQATGPIDVRTLWAARDAGLLGPVTDPGHI